MIDHAKLRRLAEDAKDEWTLRAGFPFTFYRVPLATACHTVRKDPDAMVTQGVSFSEGARAFIAAANPTTIIELLDEIDRLKAERMHDK